jgi:hypothetical protein
LPGPAPLHPALPPQVRGQAQEALRAALYASSLVFTEVVMALPGYPEAMKMSCSHGFFTARIWVASDLRPV